MLKQCPFTLGYSKLESAAAVRLSFCSSMSLKRLFSATAGGVSAEYKDRYRSLIFNLRDAKNPQLRQRVLQGEVDPHQLVRMSAAEMASKVG